MVKARKYVVTKYFEGMPKRSDFEIVEEELPPLKDGEILVQAKYISVDPYLRAYNFKYPVPYEQFSYTVGIVQESKNVKFPVGSNIVSNKGWCDYYIINPDDTVDLPGDKVYVLPDFKGLPISLGVGAVGIPGVTAYFGCLEICQPKVGETLVVTGAGNAVGSIVGQIAKIKGCRVIGFAGSDKRIQWLEKELGFDKVINYKTADIAAALKEAAPNGVDCYFDNVGGEISSIIIGQMNTYGRVALCGSISIFDDDFSKLPKATIVQPNLVFNQIKIEGFNCWRWIDRWFEAFNTLIDWISSGKIKAHEHVTVGFDKMVDAFVGMLAGENIGKSIVKV